jgi:hypothetical protein
MVGTLLTFTTVPLAALERIGIVVEQDDAEAYMHTWSVVGHLLGVAPDVLPLTYQEALDLQTQVFTKLQGPSPDALELGGALNQALASSFRLPVLRGLPASIITYLCGKEIAEINGVRADWLIMALEPLHLLATLIGQAQRHSHLMREFSSLVSAAMFRDFLHANRPGRPGFTMPRSLSSRVSDMHARWTL